MQNGDHVIGGGSFNTQGAGYMRILSCKCGFKARAAVKPHLKAKFAYKAGLTSRLNILGKNLALYSNKYGT